MVAASLAGSAVPEEVQSDWEESLTCLLLEEGDWDAEDPHLQACVRRGGALVAWLAGREGVDVSLAMTLALEQCQLEAADDSNGSSSNGSSDDSCSGGGGDNGGLLSAKFRLFRRLTSAEPGWAVALARALSSCPEAAELPLDDTRAALHFAAAQVGAKGGARGSWRRSEGVTPLVAAGFTRTLRPPDAAAQTCAFPLLRDVGHCPGPMCPPHTLSRMHTPSNPAAVQLQLASRRRHAQLSAPYSLPRLFLLHPYIGGTLLAQHPAAFEAAAAPWLRTQLGWGDTELADAALTDSFHQLCKFDTAAAQAALDWLRSKAGLSQQQAARLLAPPGLRLLASDFARQAAERARMEQLAEAWGVGLDVAAALVLSQLPLSASSADLTGRLVATLQASCPAHSSALACAAARAGQSQPARVCMVQPSSPRISPRLQAASHRRRQADCRDLCC